MKKISKKLMFLLFLLIKVNITNAQTIYSVPIGKLVDAGSSGFILPNGIKATAYEYGIGDGVLGSLNGKWNTNPASVGGTYNGIDDANVNTAAATATGGLAIAGYNGSKDPKTFTLIQGDRRTIDRGNADNYKSAVVFHLHFNAPIEISQFLFVDLDGNPGTNSSNDE